VVSGRSAASEFVLATSASASRTEIQDEIADQADALGENGIRFEVWDNDRLSRLLKSQPDIVADFFGPGIASAFLPGYATIKHEELLKEFEARLEDATTRLEERRPPRPHWPPQRVLH
jgi:hypothetical protein